MDTGRMVIDVFARKGTFNLLSLCIKCTAIATLSYGNSVYAFNLRIDPLTYDITVTPFVSAQQTYSDNINLAPSGKEQSAFVTDISPGVSIVGQSARSNLNLNYKMQNLYNAGGNNNLETFNQLQYNSKTALVQNILYLDSRSSISQQNSNSNNISNDNLSNRAGSTTVTTFSLSPYWLARFGDYANGNIRINFDTVSTENSALPNNQNTINALSDTKSLSEIIQLNSGSEFQRINWNLYHNNSTNYRDNGDDVKFQNSNLIVRTYIDRHFNVFVSGGYSNNSFKTKTNSSQNGVSYTFGGQWVPSQFYSIEMGGGNNNHITVSIAPIKRLTWTTTFNKNSVGLNSGQTWQTALNYQTSHSNWSLTHENDTTTVQEILMQQRIFTLQDEAGNTIFDPVTNQAAQRAINIPTLTNDVIVRQKWNFSTSYNTGKSTINLSAFNEDRAFQLNSTNQVVQGISATWNWQFASKTSAYIRPLWQQTDNGLNSKSDRYDFTVGINESITSQITGKLEFRHLNQVSDLTNINTNSYQENRATASLFMRY